MIIVSTRIKGDDRVELVGDDGKEYHFVNAENAAYWMGANTTGLPTLASISPTTAVSGAADITVTLTGTNFNTSSQVLVNNVVAQRTYVSPTSMTTVLPVSQVAGYRLWQISVRNGVYQTAARPFSLTTTNLAPSFTVEAVISGTQAVGSTLTCDNGTVVGSPAPTISKQWKRSGTNIPAATGDSYLLVPADQGTVITCLVTASNTSGSAASTPSTGIIAASGGGGTTTITQDGLVITLNGSLTVTQDVLGNNIVHNVSGIFPSVVTALPTIDPAKASEDIGGHGTANYVGQIMLDPHGMTKQGSDNRLRPSSGGRGPGMAGVYDASLAQALPISIDASSVPKTLWFYRGNDTIISAGECGCAYWVHVTFCKTSDIPGTPYIRPQIYHVAAGKTFLPTSAINYAAFTPIAIPVGAVEPDWSDIHYLRRPLVQSGEFVIGNQSMIGIANPAGSQVDYVAYQARYTGDLLLGMVSNSASRNTLINRVVAVGRDLQAQIAYTTTGTFSAGGGWGIGYEAIRYFASKFLGDAAMGQVPPDVDIGIGTNVKYFSEMGSIWKGAADGTYPGGKPLYGIIGYGYPTGPFSDNHDARDMVTPGVREPWWMLGATGTIQTGSTASVLKLGTATGYAAGTISQGYSIYCPRGGGETIIIASWDNATKTATMSRPFATAPQVGDVWEYTNGGYYEQLNLQPHVALSTAIVAAGYAADYGALASGLGTVVLAMTPRWIAEQGVFVPRTRVDVQHASQQLTTADINTHCYNGDVSGVWCKKFYTAVAASFPVIPASVTFTPVTFDGTNDYLSRGANITGFVDGEEFTYVCRFRVGTAGAGTTRYFVHDAADNFKIQLITTDQLDGYMYQGVNGRIIFRSTEVFLNADGMITLFVAGKTTAGSEVLQVYRDNTALTAFIYTHIAGPMDLTSTDWKFFAAANATGKMDASVEMVWFDNKYYDVSNSTVRGKWLPANINADGSGPGAIPKVFKFGAASAWNAGTNLGTGGNLTMTGAVT